MTSKTVPEVRIDRSRTLAEDGTGHNRWHPDIPPVIRCDPGDEAILETRDAFDGQFGRDVSLEVVRAPNLDRLHPLTGPVYVEGAEPGDLLDIEIVDIEAELYCYTTQVPGFGFLRDVFPEPFKVSWDIADGWATSADLPGVRIPGAPFMGTIGVAPDRALLEAATAREQALLDRAGSCCHRRPGQRSPRTSSPSNGGTMRPDIVPGGVFPDYSLPDHTGTAHTLSELQGDDPMILTLARGHF